MSSVLWVLLAGVAIVLIATLLRRMGEDRGAIVPPPDETGARERTASHAEVVADDEPDEDDEDDEEVPEGMIAVTSEGLAFVPRQHSVLVTSATEVQRRAARHPRRRPAKDGEEAPPSWLETPAEDHHPSVQLHPGDLIAVRVRKGGPDTDPWRVETLGRDRDLTVWVFETEDAAETARELLARRIVRPPLDETGDPIPVGDEDFWAAERELERTLQELDAPDAPDEDEGRRT